MYIYIYIYRLIKYFKTIKIFKIFKKLTSCFSHWIRTVSLPDPLLITKRQPVLCIQKQLYLQHLLNNPIGPRAENIITHTDSSGLR